MAEGKRRGQKVTDRDSGARSERGQSEAARTELAAQRDRLRQVREFRIRKAHQRVRTTIEFDAKDKEILTLHLNRPDLTQKQIGDYVGLTRKAVNERMNAPKFKRAMSEATRDAIDILRGAQPRAVRVLIELLGSPDERTRMGAAKSLASPLLQAERQDAGAEDLASIIQEAWERAQQSPKSQSNDDRTNEGA